MARKIGDNWEETCTSLSVLDAEGKEIIMKDIRAYKHKEDGDIAISLEDLVDAMKRFGIYES